MTSRHARRVPAALLVFVTLLGSNAYFWHARDWNVSSRLMLTYALADRGTVAINGLEDHTRDRARVGLRFYSDKAPGFSLLAVPPYLAARALLGLPEHPLNRPGAGFTHWPADYWITLGTSGVATALAGAVLTLLAGALGCGPRRSALVGLAYGLATPAYIYATLGYGHQVAASCLLGSFALLWTAPGRPRAGLRAGLAGLLAAWAVVVELALTPVAAVLGLYALALVAGRRLPGSAVAAFALGALGPMLVLLAYNQLAFGSPLAVGYFHEDILQFRDVHSAGNPLGLRAPDWSRALPLLWGSHRGLLFYAPIVVLSVPGWVVLGARRFWGVLAVSAGACLAVFLVNLGYPEWTGGWSTGPRLLVPLLPFALLPVAALLPVGGRGVTAAAVVLAVAGGALMVLFQGAGGRVPQDIADPLWDFVWPLWCKNRVATPIAAGFDRTIVSALWPGRVARLPERWAWLQVLPLFGFQAATVAVIVVRCLERRPECGRPAPEESCTSSSP